MEDDIYIGKEELRQYYLDGEKGPKPPCVFENGSEGEMFQIGTLSPCGINKRFSFL